jgi:hypothetical protein
MTNDFQVVEGRSVTLWQTAGPGLSVIVAAVAFAMLTLFAAGVAARLRGGRPWVFGWWLRSLSVWTGLLGLFAYASHWASVHGTLGRGAIRSDLWHELNLEAYTRLALPLLLALVGWALGTALGPEPGTGPRGGGRTGPGGRSEA